MLDIELCPHWVYLGNEFIQKKLGNRLFFRLMNTLYGLIVFHKRINMQHDFLRILIKTIDNKKFVEIFRLNYFSYKQ